PHVSSGVRSAGCNLIATRVFGMSETIAITGKSVKLFKGHYTSPWDAVYVPSKRATQDLRSVRNATLFID
ncbi:MAG: hypothetical protein ACREYE_23070, partial [Gammaproteobacteria bacterium]